MSSDEVRRRVRAGGAGLVAATLLSATFHPLLGQTRDVTTTIEVSLDVSELDTGLIDEPFANALLAASMATLTVSYPPFGWDESYVDPLEQFADHWTFLPSTMGYVLEVGPSRWEGTNAGSASSAWSRVTFGSFASADGSLAYRVAVGDELLQIELRAEELPRDLAMFNLPYLEGQEFPAFAEDLTASYARRLVVEIQGLGPLSVMFTGYSFSHGEPVLGVTVGPSRGVSTEQSSWGAVKALYH